MTARSSVTAIAGPPARAAGLGRREAAIFLAFADAVLAPQAPLPAVADTDALASFERLLRATPRPNRLALRAGLRALDAGPRALRFHGSLRALSPERRLAYVQRLEAGPLGTPVKALASLAAVSYYGDDDVMRLLGYDPEARLRRGRELREREGRW
jgi:hypothetical protein